tara:strand:- start:101 stop:463 length:363 start_codon:yes stop_codon:yes gene_type:complete
MVSAEELEELADLVMDDAGLTAKAAARALLSMGAPKHERGHDAIRDRGANVFVAPASLCALADHWVALWYEDLEAGKYNQMGLRDIIKHTYLVGHWHAHQFGGAVGVPRLRSEMRICGRS